MVGLAVLLSAAGAWPVEVEAPPPRPDARDPFFQIASDASVGAKGEEALEVSTTRACGHTNWVFDHAELNIERNRFGDAQFVQLPSPGCFVCDPVVVRWYHEPTGHLAFHVRVWRRPVQPDCSGKGPAAVSRTTVDPARADSP